MLKIRKSDQPEKKLAVCVNLSLNTMQHKNWAEQSVGGRKCKNNCEDHSGLAVKRDRMYWGRVKKR